MDSNPSRGRPTLLRNWKFSFASVFRKINEKPLALYLVYMPGEVKYPTQGGGNV